MSPQNRTVCLSRCERACKQGSFGLNCSRSCDYAEDTPCDPVSGSCICSSGQTGVRCDSGGPPELNPRRSEENQSHLNVS
ncbi:multiple epidermal growth factor-like domains protein 11 isoform X3 [Carassius auratus]|uniref:Multiple epidermal growth factor-like domains protein 11 isoform X3 n=1 Tax=Carassius auratus TaxID=7957 RepID=A0A6P6L1Y8_CARAU|nr:multiple epidermal growth factor-like domains protein 11 isoform X3 [Carassius auratus]